MSRTPVSAHFALEEFVPVGVPVASVPEDVALHLAKLAQTILEPVREHFGRPLYIHSGWRPPRVNAAAGGTSASDHLTGRAADFHAQASTDVPWEAATDAAFEFIRTELAGHFGQLILEDHRAFLSRPGKFWVHVAIPSPKHPGDGTDPAAVLYSYRPGVYQHKRNDQ